MPFRPEQSLLRVEVPALHTIDTSSVENLFGMWSLFSKASHAMEDGRRLENLSWRLWNRETFCCSPEAKPRSSRRTRTSVASRSDAAVTSDQLPALSSSLDSASATDSDSDGLSCISRARPELRRPTFSSTSAQSRGREKHITPTDLQNFVQSIRETPDVQPIDFAIPTPASLNDESDSEQMADTSATTDSMISSKALESSAASTIGTATTNDSKTSPSHSFGSDDTSTTEMSTHSIVRGFVPGGAPSSYRSQTNLATQPTPILKKAAASRAPPRKKGPVFTIGTSSGEDESLLESHMYKSSLSESLRRSPTHIPSTASNLKKQTSLNQELTVARHSPVFESDDEDEDAVSESAIEDDDDSSDWEDSDDQSGPSSVNEKELFQRVDSRPNLTSRRSLLTTLMHEPDRAKALANAASRSTPAFRRSRTTTPNGPSIATSPETGVQMAMPGQAPQLPSQLSNATRSQPIAMMGANGQPAQMALSPRTTRRNMLSTELTESLRKNLLWERQHRSSGNLAALKRRHTSHDVKSLKQHPETGAVATQGADTYGNDYFHAGLQEYHAQGW